MVATRAAADRCGAGYGVPPLVLQGGHRERRPAGDRRLAPPGWDLPSILTSPTAGTRPASMVEQWPHEKVERHTGVGNELVQALDALVLQMEEQLPDVLQFFATCLPVVAEQVIDVPKISFEDIPKRRSRREPQLAEQLVEVPTVLSLALFQEQFAEQTVNIPVPRGSGRRLQGLRPGQGSQRTVEQIVNIPAGGGLHGFLPDPGGSRSSAVTREEAWHVFFRTLPQKSNNPATAGWFDVPVEPGEGVFRTFPHSKKSAASAAHPSPRVHASVCSSTRASQLRPFDWVMVNAGEGPYNWNRRDVLGDGRRLLA